MTKKKKKKKMNENEIPTNNKPSIVPFVLEGDVPSVSAVLVAFVYSETYTGVKNGFAAHCKKDKCSTWGCNDV